MAPSLRVAPISNSQAATSIMTIPPPSPNHATNNAINHQREISGGVARSSFNHQVAAPSAIVTYRRGVPPGEIRAAKENFDVNSISRAALQASIFNRLKANDIAARRISLSRRYPHEEIIENIKKLSTAQINSKNTLMLHILTKIGCFEARLFSLLDSHCAFTHCATTRL